MSIRMRGKVPTPVALSGIISYSGLYRVEIKGVSMGDRGDLVGHVTQSCTPLAVYIYIITIMMAIISVIVLSSL